MYVVSVTIGRNVGTTPMSDVRWATFEDEVSEYLSSGMQSDDTLEIHRGRGIWDGVEEESTKITLLTNSTLPYGTIGLREFLSDLARRYDQDAIALTVGESELVTS